MDMGKGAQNGENLEAWLLELRLRCEAFSQTIVLKNCLGTTALRTVVPGFLVQDEQSV